ncbi:endolytic transglycosylase MltG [Algicella marina]|uniref:Endolytic murein transglycosylase n=1 Tax=Algicella marina TaxID=2683284 RepID=A0A6P1SXR2_9RHOB|nr:endolytic transglycosylase MltG [Algicella marina]QHQ34547.1 endolytic transglycosylase MltG [Algicella marina]
MTRHLAANGMTLLIAVLICVLSYLGWAASEYANRAQVTDEVIFEVESGSNWRRTSEKLEREGVISSSSIFRIGLRYDGLTDELKRGVYAVPGGATMKDIAALFSEGGAGGARYRLTYLIRADGVEVRLSDQIGSEDFAGMAPEALAVRAAELVESNESISLRVAVPEGLTSYQISEGLNAVPLLTGEIAEVPAEGSLAPNTYEVRDGKAREELLAEMAAAQRQRVADAWAGRDLTVPVESPEELLILASIIEKETGVPEERGRVASVFANRLERGMRLQTDPTVIYGLTEGKGALGRGLRRSELDRATPYNTYIIEGLPPTPIANPGELAIKAAAQPDTTDFLFFVADGTGGHAFAQTLVEHEENVARWREIEASRDN